MKNCIKIIFGILFIALLSSCLTLELDLQLSNDGSGTAQFTYIVSNDLMEIANPGEVTDNLPLNLNRDFIDSLVASNQGLNLRDYKVEESVKSTTIYIEIDFDSLEDFNLIIDSGNKINLTTNGNRYELTQDIYKGNSQSYSGDTIELYRGIFAENYVLIKLTVDNNIISISNGDKISSKEAEIRIPLISFLESKEDLSWGVIW